MENQNVELENRKNLKVTGVIEILGFSDKEIRLLVSNKQKLLIMGENLKVKSFSQTSGEFYLEGEISCVKYQGEKIGALKRLLK